MAKPVAKNKAKKTKGDRSKSESPSVVMGSMPLEDERHEIFCQEILLMKPQVRAYMKAFPESSYESARANSSRLIAKDSVSSRLEFLRSERKARYKMTAEDLHERMVMAASVDPADLVDHLGNSVKLEDLPPEVRICIEAIEIDDIEVGRGEDKKHIGITKKIKFISKSKMLELLGRQLGIFNDRLHLSGGLTLEELICGKGGDDE